MSQYFEGILQVRNPKEKVLDYIYDTIEKNSDRVYVAKVEEVRGGIDLYLSSNKFLVKLAKMLEKNIGGEVKISARLHTRDHQKSRDLHRVTALFRCPDYTKGDVVMADGKLIRVTRLGKNIKGQDLRSGKPATFRPGDDIQILEKHKTRVSKVYPRPEVLHPETFESVKVENPAELALGQNVKVVISEGKLFLA